MKKFNIELELTSLEIDFLNKYKHNFDPNEDGFVVISSDKEIDIAFDLDRKGVVMMADEELEVKGVMFLTKVGREILKQI